MWMLKHVGGYKPYLAQTECMKKYKKVREVVPGFGMYMEMGLGKTGTEYNIFATELYEDKIDGEVLLCPPSLVGNWRNEFYDWGLDKAGVNVYVWPKVDINKIRTPFFIIMNYEAISVGGMKGDDLIVDLYSAKRWRIRIGLDESIQIKNPQSVKTVKLISHSHNTVSRCTMSGEPTSQGPQDYWAQLRFNGAITGNFFAFRNTFCQMGGFKGRKVMGTKNEQKLAELLDRCCFFAKKEDYTDLPPKIYLPPREVGLSKQQLEHYRSMEQDFITFVNGVDDVTAVEAELIVTKLNKLQQISSGFIFDNEREVHYIPGEIPKIKETKEIMEQLGTKLVVVAFYKPSIEILARELKQYEPAVLNGGMKIEDVEHQKSRFNNDPNCRVAILQESSHKYGHTLLGKKGKDRCHTVLFYENSFSLDDRRQMEDRPHRYGQDTAVSYIDFACSGIERSAIEALQHKKNLADRIWHYIKERQ